MSQPPDFDRPSRHGKALGEALALLAAAGRKDAPMTIPDCCLTCAFRPGTLPNMTAGTVKQALDCVLDIDPDRFACHHGMRDGAPTKLCAGYVAAILAPWSFAKEVLAAVHAELEAIKDGDPDYIRDAFNAWLAETDPEGRMDEYQMARAYAARSLKSQPPSVPGHAGEPS